MLANQIKQYIKRTKHQDQVGFIRGFSSMVQKSQINQRDTTLTKQKIKII